MPSFPDPFAIPGAAWSPPEPMAPLPIVLPQINYGFNPQRDPASGNVLGVVFVVQFPGSRFQVHIPFDRLNFAGFLRQAQQAYGESDNGPVAA